MPLYEKSIKILRHKDSEVTKVLLAGNGGIGKSTWMNRFINDNYEPKKITIGVEFGVKKYLIEDNEKTLIIWDLGGQKQFKYLILDFIKSADGILLCFDISRYKSFIDLNDWLNKLRTKFEDIPIILVGTKSDLKYHPALNREIIFDYVKKMNLLNYYEISSKNDVNITLPIQKLIKNIENSQIVFSK